MANFNLTKEELKELLKENPQLRQQLKKYRPDEELLNEFTIEELRFRPLRYEGKNVMLPLGETEPDLKDKHIFLNTEGFTFEIVELNGKTYLKIDEIPSSPGLENIEEPKKSKKK